MEKYVYVPPIKYKHLNDQTLDSQESEQSRVYELEQMVKDIKIPDEVEFEHAFELVKPNMCGCGPYSQRSTFNVNGLGELQFFVEKIHCCRPWCFYCIYNTCYYCCCCCIFKYFIYLLVCILSPFINCLINIFWCIICHSQAHKLPNQLYVMENSKFKLEFWQRGIGNVKARDQIILNFIQSDPNRFDKSCGGLYSTYPQLEITSPFDHNYKLILKPDKNTCPITILSAAPYLAICNIFTTSRNFHVEGLTQGKCEIINLRTGCEALARITETQGELCRLCPLVDYPRFAIQFDSVRQIDRIAIIMGLIHISMFDQWGNDTEPNLKLKFSNECCKSRNFVQQFTIVPG